MTLSVGSLTVAYSFENCCMNSVFATKPSNL